MGDSDAAQGGQSGTGGPPSRAVSFGRRRWSTSERIDEILEVSALAHDLGSHC